jgi:serine/threonine-protein kinase ATR
MARKSGGSTQRKAPLPTTNVSTNGNNPPPSTIAAQIVHNAANVHSRQDAAAKVTFGDLVKEFLQHPSIDEPDTQLVAFICVVVEAGLDGLSKDDPFAQDQQRDQGTNSIHALIYLLTQKPHLLLCAKEGDNTGSPQPPVIIWLFPKLLGLLTYATLQPIHQHVQDLLNTCLSVLAQAPAYVRQTVAVMQLYKSSIVCMCLCFLTHAVTNSRLDIRDELKAVSDPATTRAASFRTAIPSSSSLNEFWPESKQFVAVPHDLQRTIASPIPARFVSLNLLMALCVPTRQKPQHVRFEQHYPWILDICEELWHYFRRWTTGSDTHPLHDEIVALYMRLVKTLVSTSSAPRCLSSNSSKAALACSSSVAGLIKSLATLSMSESNQVQLAILATHFCHVARNEAPQRSVLDRRRRSACVFDTDLLKQSARRICENTEVFSGLQKDLQVCVPYYLPGTYF